MMRVLGHLLHSVAHDHAAQELLRSAVYEGDIQDWDSAENPHNALQALVLAMLLGSQFLVDVGASQMLFLIPAHGPDTPKPPFVGRSSSALAQSLPPCLDLIAERQMELMPRSSPAG